MTHTAQGTFEVELAPGPAEAGGAVARFDFTKTFTGDLEGTGTGLMLSVGDPGSGEAGYVAIETVRGRIGELEGAFALQQLGRMSGGAQELTYLVVPGSGQGALATIAGALALTIAGDGTHHYVLTYDL